MCLIQHPNNFFSNFNLPIIVLAGVAFHSSQNVMKDDVTRIMPGMKTVVK